MFQSSPRNVKISQEFNLVHKSNKPNTMKVLRDIFQTYLTVVTHKWVHTQYPSKSSRPGIAVHNTFVFIPTHFSKNILPNYKSTHHFVTSVNTDKSYNVSYFTSPP